MTKRITNLQSNYQIEYYVNNPKSDHRIKYNIKKNNFIARKNERALH